MRGRLLMTIHATSRMKDHSNEFHWLLVKYLILVNSFEGSYFVSLIVSRAPQRGSGDH